MGMKEKLINSFNHLLFNLKRNKFLYTLLAVLLVAGSFSAYPYYLSPQRSDGTSQSGIKGDDKTLKNQSPASASQNSAQNPSPQATEQQSSSNISTNQSSNQNNATNNNNSTPNNPQNPSNPTPEPQPEPEPETPPPPTPESPSATVAFYADSQSDTDEEDVNHQRVVNYILNTSANPVFHAGDLLEDGTVDSLNRFNNVTTTLRASRTFYAAQGNNERNSSVYFDNFNFPGNEHWYSVNVGNLHMVILDNYASSVAIGSEQYNWLASDLQSAASQSRITGVMFHYPVYGIGGDYKGLIGSLVPLFRSYGVDFVISGHEHIYQKTIVDDIYYFVNSGQTAIGYMIARIYSDRVEFTVYNANNGVIDTVSFNER